MNNISITPADAVWVDENWIVHRVVDMPEQFIRNCLELESGNTVWRTLFETELKRRSGNCD